MRFSFWPSSAQPYEVMKSLGQHVEATGWDGFWMADHFMPNEGDIYQPYHEVWTTLAALSTVVPRIRLGTLVVGNTYRHPAVLANMAATLDNICDGRLVLGIGSGWQVNEHEKYGLEFGTVNSRLRKLEEACQVIKGLFQEQSFSFQGDYYTLNDAVLVPKPKQTRLPLLIGGGGEKLTLKITARYADEWNVWGDVATLKHKMAILDQHCDAAGRDPANIQRSAVALLFLSNDEAFIKRMKGSPAAMPSIVGNVAEVRDIVKAYQDAGVDELIVPDFTMGPGQQKLDTLDLFINEVASACN